MQNCNIPEDSLGKKLDDFGFYGDFLRQQKRYNTWKEELISQTLLKLKMSTLWKKMSKKMRRQAMNWDKMFMKSPW
jgi:hypothetical protein